MGGWSYVRPGGKPTTEGALRIDLADCNRRGMMCPGRWVRGTMSWTLVRTDEVIGTVAYEACMISPECAWMRLSYASARRAGPTVKHDYRIELEVTRPNYGGVRWWFRCPKSGRRVRVLYNPGFGDIFASRQAWGLAYQSQRISPERRADERSLKAQRKLNVRDPCLLDMPYCPKPKWMRWKTHQRLVGVIQQSCDMNMRYMVRRWGNVLDDMHLP
jgi:hypothetical protein